MARNRDRVSNNGNRSLKRLTKELGRRPEANVRVNEEDRRNIRLLYNREPTGADRVTGRRGVRARRREARIAQRQANGTYRQPTGGTITNS